METQTERKDQVAQAQTNQAGNGAALGSRRRRHALHRNAGLEDWVLQPGLRRAPLLENKLGVLSLEGFGLQGRPLRLRRRGPFCITSAPPSAGTLEHVDRIGFYDRQEYLVLDAVTVRKPELVEPLFANTSSEVTLFARFDATLTPMGKRLLRSVDAAAVHRDRWINRRLDAVEAGVKRICRPGRTGAGRWRACSISNAC